MKSQAFFSALALVILCVVPTSTAHSSTSTSTSTAYVESTTVKSSNSTQQSSHSTVQGPQQTDEYSEAVYSQEPPEPKQYRSDYFDEPTGEGYVPRNSTYLPDQSSSENPSATIDCPGPEDPNTGEAVLDSDLNCAIVCYNNLIPNEAGDACICPPTFQFDPVEVKCVCRSPYVQRGAKCVLLPSQAATRHGSHKKRSLNQQLPLDFTLLHGKYLRSEVDRRHCPDNEIACQMKTGGFECLDPEVTLDSCGGCTSMGTGMDCRNITGAGEVGCNQGTCVVLTCQSGFKFVNGGCVPKNHRRSY